jgi:hypothetical protein
MPAINVSIPHALGQHEARARVTEFLESVQRDYSGYVSEVRGTWTDNRLDFGFAAAGMPLTGTLTVDESAVHVSVPLPMMASLFKGRIEKTIGDELKKLVGRTTK